MISAPVSFEPQRNSPLLGDDAIWLSKKSKLVFRFGAKKFDSMAPVRSRATGLMKNGADLLITGYFFSPMKGSSRLTVLTPHYNRKNQVWHQTSFRIMHQVPIPQPFLSFSPHLSFLSLCIALRYKVGPIMINEILDDHPGFGEHERFGSRLRLYGQNGGLAKRMDSFQLWGCQLILPFVCFNLILDFAFFQKPENPL